MTVSSVLTSGSQDLVTFQNVVRQNEANLGPLTTLSVSGDNNMMTFKFGDGPDAQHLVTLVQYTTHPTQPAGMTLVCAGKCLVQKTEQQVAAYRPAP